MQPDPLTPLFLSGRARGDGARDVTPRALEASLGSVRVIDVREPSEFESATGRVPGSALLPLGRLQELMTRPSRSDPVVLVCRSGNRSGVAAAALVRAGFSQVMNLAGGMTAWNAERLPIESGLGVSTR